MLLALVLYRTLLPLRCSHRPLAPKLDAMGRRRCLAQISEIEDHAEAGTVVASHEAMGIVGMDGWDTLPMPVSGSSVVAHTHTYICNYVAMEEGAVY